MRAASSDAVPPPGIGQGAGSRQCDARAGELVADGSASLNESIFMVDNKHKDPLHGVTLEIILTHLVEKYGWEEMSRRIRINCFAKNPSIKSSLIFLRRTPWARKKVECLYIEK